jgi:hypothetical protein
VPFKVWDGPNETRRWQTPEAAIVEELYLVTLSRPPAWTVLEQCQSLGSTGSLSRASTPKTHS